MVRTIEAIYENGVFRPIAPPEGLKEHDRVRLAVVRSGGPATHPMVKHCGGLSDEDAQEMLRVIGEEFEKVDPNEWK